MAYEKKITEALNSLKHPHRNLVLYNAGSPRYEHFFTRDSIVSAILLRDPKILRDTLSYCAERQGKESDSYSGEEFGKILHEYPSAVIRGLATSFNACDATAMFLIGHELYESWSGDSDFKNDHEEAILGAIGYIKKHTNEEGAFMEDPSLAGATKFSLKVTYWKDSEIFGRKNGEPKYPVIYTFAHIQNLRGIRAGAKLLKNKDLDSLADKMLNYLKTKLIAKNGSFVIAVDQEGEISAVSSDFLHALSYLNPGDLDEKTLSAIISASSKLETSAGYRGIAPEAAQYISDPYHTKTVWPFEQAMIHNGVRKHRIWAEGKGFYSLAEKLSHAEEVSFSVNEWMDGIFPELFVIDTKGGIKKGGNEKQLWSVAAKEYFEKIYLDGLVM